MAPSKQQHINAQITSIKQTELGTQLQSENDEMRGWDGSKLNALISSSAKKTINK